MPPTFEMLLVASERTLGQMDSSGVMALSMPLKACDRRDAPDDASAEKKKRTPDRKRNRRNSRR